MKKRKIIFFLVVLTAVVISILNISFIKRDINVINAIFNQYVAEQVVYEYQGLVMKADKLVAGSKNEIIMENNTKYLQEYIDTVSNAGGGKVEIPAGTYYFTPRTANSRRNEDYIIKARNNVLVEGQGTDETNFANCTILKPFGKVKYSNSGGIDMFYYNNYHDSNFQDKTYLENADFKNFIIDGAETEGIGYNSSGKGFMFVIVKDCDYENIIVRNTEATGFGMDCPVNCTIKNCKAIDCGRTAKSTDVGASGFGIGTGYSNNESIMITNCTALGNKKFGFFFEHQTRFCGSNHLLVYPADTSEGFVVSNCIASGNMYDFGGARANDVTYENCTSNNSHINPNVTNMAAFHFENSSTRVHIVGSQVKRQFEDVTNEIMYYYKPVYWALNNGITEGVSKTQFKPERAITRAEAVAFLWRAAGMPGNVLHGGVLIENEYYESIYSDVKGKPYYIEAAKWAKDEEIICSSETFRPNDVCTRAEFLTMIWRYAGKPKVTTGNNFTDVVSGAYYEEAVNWAVSKGILKGTTTKTFSPNQNCRRAEAVTFLYRYANTQNEFSITYNLGGGIASDNPIKYNAGQDELILNNPVKTGYTFIGWTGSNYETTVNQEEYIPQERVTITKKDLGNKTYTANWLPNTYTITFNSNGGKGKMENEYFIYDNVPQKLLKNQFTRSNYKFKGWNTESNGNGISYVDEQAVKNLIEASNGNVTLYAQWEKKISNSGSSNRIIIPKIRLNRLNR